MSDYQRPAFLQEEHKTNKFYVQKALKRFVTLVSCKKPIPQDLLDFIAGGVQAFMEGGKPWPVKVGKPSKEESTLALVLEIDRKFPRKRASIAAHLNVTERQVTNLLKRAQEKEKQGVGQSGIRFHSALYSKQLEKGNLVDWLNALTELAGKEE